MQNNEKMAEVVWIWAKIDSYYRVVEQTARLLDNSGAWTVHYPYLSFLNNARTNHINMIQAHHNSDSQFLE